MERPKDFLVKTVIIPSSSTYIMKAAHFLLQEQLVAFPTETVYGLGADATSSKAVAGIYHAKGRPSFNPLIAHIDTLEMAQKEGVFNTKAELLAKAFWPGALTLVLPVAETSTVSELARAGLQSIALRIPNHPIALSLIHGVERPIVAPSANRSGHVSPTTAHHVLEDLDGHIAAILDGGMTMIGVESTIVACLDEKVVLLRAGGVSREEIERVLGESLVSPHSLNRKKPLAPGMLTSHYAPNAKVSLESEEVFEDSAVLLFGSFEPRGIAKARRVINLSPSGDIKEAASNLYAALRALDGSDISQIHVVPIPHDGLGEAINDRLMRAAAERK